MGDLSVGTAESVAEGARGEVSTRDGRGPEAGRLDAADGRPANPFGSADRGRYRGNQAGAIYQWLSCSPEGRRAGRTDRANGAGRWLKRDSGPRTCLVCSPAVPARNFGPRP